MIFLKTGIINFIQELLVNLNYSDPQDAESELAVWPGPGHGPGHGNINQAYEAEDIVTAREPGHHPLLQQHIKQPQRNQDINSSYKVKFGHDIYYCKPYQPFHTQLRYNFSGIKLLDYHRL